MPAGTFDTNAFLETSFSGNLDTTYVLPPEDDYTAQITDRLTFRSGRIEKGDRAGQTWATADLQWELLDDTLKQTLNLDRVLVRQSLMLDLLPDSTPDSPRLDFGTNKNMRLKRLLDATGLNSKKSWNFGMFKFATATVHVEHRKPEGFDDFMAEVTRVAPMGQAASSKKKVA
jgi:hypothetical protein